MLSDSEECSQSHQVVRLNDFYRVFGWRGGVFEENEDILNDDGLPMINYTTILSSSRNRV